MSEQNFSEINIKDAIVRQDEVTGEITYVALKVGDKTVTVLRGKYDREGKVIVEIYPTGADGQPDLHANGTTPLYYEEIADAKHDDFVEICHGYATRLMVAGIEGLNNFQLSIHLGRDRA